MKLSLDAKRMILVIGASSLVIIAGGIIFFRSLEALPFAFGVLLMAALNAVKVVMLERAVYKISGMGEKEASNYMRIRYLLRFVITGVVLYIAVAVQFISLWGAIAGVFTFQIAAHSLRFFPEENKQTAENS